MQLDKKQYKIEILGGITNFLAISYIIIVNPLILNANGSGLNVNASITATILSMIVMTMIAGIVVKLPFVIAPAMGMNALISYTFIVHDKLSVADTMGVIFWSSVLLFIFSITNLRKRIIDAIPLPIQTALTVGIGVFLLLIGIKNANIIISNPDTLLSINKINFDIILCFLMFILAVILFNKKKSYAMILPITIITIFNLINKYYSDPNNHLFNNLIARPDFSLFMQIDLLSCLKLSILPAIISLFVVNFFDASASVLGLLNQIKFSSQHIKNTYYKRTIKVDAIAGMVSGIVGTSPSTVFVESAAAIQMGAKTGIASIVTGICCIPFLFISPIINMIPLMATAPVLMLVGILMMNYIKTINLQHFEDFVAVSLTIVMMPLCFSITAGAVFGIISYTLLKILLGKYKDLSKDLIIISILCAGWFYN